MGYTHYWYTTPKLDEAKFKAFAEDAKKLFAVPGVAQLICFESDEPDEPPMATADVVRFNGKDDDGHETFFFDRMGRTGRHDNNKTFAFCKTAHKPYDKVVLAVLLLAKHHFGDDVDVSSDGNWNEWMAGRALYSACFDREAVNPLERDDDAAET